MLKKDNMLSPQQYSGYFILSMFMLLSFVIQKADRLAGKFFPSDSPILAGYYPNDFLPWGIILFLGLSFVCVSLIPKNISVNFRRVIFIVVIGLTYLILMFVSFRFHNLRSISGEDILWASQLSDLIEICGWAWLIGGGLSFQIYFINAS